MDVKPALVKELRERTGAGMMDCKKALVEASGDLDAAGELLRKQGQAKADKKASRVAAEGRVVLKSDESAGRYALVEVNSETDFVAKDDNFRGFAERVAGRRARQASRERRGADGPRDRTGARSRKAGSSSSRRSARTSTCAASRSSRARALSARTCTARGSACSSSSRAARPSSRATWRCRSRRLRRAICRSDDVPKDVLAKEREIIVAQTAEEKKPPEIIAKMVDGKLRKFVDEITLTGQMFVKDDKKRVRDVLAANKAKVKSFRRFEVGEGIEKKTTDFVSEVMAQASQTR